VGRFAAGGVGEGLGWKRGGKGEVGEVERRERGKGKWREGEVEGSAKEGPKLLLNQGPSEPCYATGSTLDLPVDQTDKTV